MTFPRTHTELGSDQDLNAGVQRLFTMLNVTSRKAVLAEIP